MTRSGSPWVLFSCLLVGCYAVHGREEASIDAGPDAARACRGAGELELLAMLDGMSAWARRRVVIASFESATDEEAEHAWASLRVAEASGVVDDGVAVIECGSLLDAHPRQPTLAMFVDVDDDGRCSEPDVGLVAWYFVWPTSDGTVRTLWHGDELLPVTELRGPGDPRQPRGFCDYFESPLEGQ